MRAVVKPAPADIHWPEALARDEATLANASGQCCRAAVPAPRDTIQGDAGQLSQLFLNVVTNAMEAAGPGGSVEITMQEVGGKVIVEVSDSGPGLAPEVAERLFDPFVTGKPEGVGLGLAVARQVARVHGGEIDWRREGERTVFRVVLPTGGSKS